MLPQTVGQANVVNYTTAEPDKAVRKHEFTITISYDLVPGFKLLVFFAREDGELVADMIEVKVMCEFKHKVKRNTQLCMQVIYILIYFRLM